MVDERCPAIPLLQRALLQAVIEHGAAHPAIDAGVVVGSLAKGKADRVSDVDVLLLATPGFHNQAASLVRSIVGEREVFHCWQGKHEEVCSYWRYIFYDMSSIEIHILDSGTEFPLAKPYLPLFDKTSCLPGLEVGGAAPSHWDFPAYIADGDGLVWELFDCLKWAQRGQRDLVRHHLRKLLSEMDKDPNIRTAINADKE
ncbi:MULTISPECIES: nucleotidyltransferase domain-containing protein [unclassified Aeromonas]|uniref:nucleotidyltransferase domain-containing protein n=1 Tax=unclassified Aeromonas TaxID=257493 RepID=UPI000FB86C7C|nr:MULTISPECIES: nucleotidyltransferase domain-containing protein [unclassified Aeromonas]MBV7439425.1 nucleotidyltransferase domain-containing protein [Aeromonas sp. sif2416]MBV7599187.1 nucleotidyltransferase domain-containing protein [Aeromonas sp. sia0103]